jgi:hypothetical protein
VWEEALYRPGLEAWESGYLLGSGNRKDVGIDTVKIHIVLYTSISLD